MACFQFRHICNNTGTWTSVLADFVAFRLSLSNGIINPLIYGILRRSVLRKLRRALCILNIVPCLRSNKVSNTNEIEEDPPFSITAWGVIFWQTSSKCQLCDNDLTLYILRSRWSIIYYWVYLLSIIIDLGFHYNNVFIYIAQQYIILYFYALWQCLPWFYKPGFIKKCYRSIPFLDKWQK